MASIRLRGLRSIRGPGLPPSDRFRHPSGVGGAGPRTNGPVTQNLLGEPPATLLPENDQARTALDAGTAAREVAASHPDYPLAWAILAEDALGGGDPVAGYAYARTGYHRSLDQLRGNGWKGHGPVPWEHEANRGFLRSLYALGQAASAIGEIPEAQRCEQFLVDSSPTAAKALTP